MPRNIKLWIVSTALGVVLVAVAFWNVVIHEGGWNLTFVIWPGLFVGLFVGVDYHDSFNWIESSITFLVSAAFWVIVFFSALSAGKALLTRESEKAAPGQQPDPPRKE